MTYNASGHCIQILGKANSLEVVKCAKCWESLRKCAESWESIQKWAKCWESMRKCAKCWERKRNN